MHSGTQQQKQIMDPIFLDKDAKAFADGGDLINKYKEIQSKTLESMESFIHNMNDDTIEKLLEDGREYVVEMIVDDIKGNLNMLMDMLMICSKEFHRE
jgi:hypothetical protein